MPEWVGGTPRICYELDMFEPSGETVERFHLSSLEYEKAQEATREVAGVRSARKAHCGFNNL